MRLRLVMLAWLMAMSGMALADPLADCLERAGDHGWERVDLPRDCPAALAELKEQQLDQLLANPIPKELKPEQLAFFRQLVSPQTSPTNWQPDYSGLQDLLNGILVAKNDEGWEQWQAFLEWLKRLDLGQYSETFKKLSNFLDAFAPSAETSKRIIYALLGGIVLAALLLVLRELYYAGVFHRHKRVPARSPARSGAPDSPAGKPTWQEVLALPPGQQAGALLGMVIDGLVDRQQLPDDPGRTNRELLALLRRHEASPAAPFERMLGEVEPVIYGGHSPDGAALERIRLSASEVLEEGTED